MGHRNDAHGISPKNEKLKIIEEFPEPTSFNQLRRFIGMVNFYRRFIPNCASLVQPLTELLKGTKKHFVFTDEAKSAFDATKKALSEVTIIKPFDLHPDSTLVLMTHASATAIAAVLQQRIGNALRPLSFFSKKLDDTQRRYSTFGRELLAVYLAVKHFNHILQARNFTILTDHKPLIHAIKNNSDRYSPRESRHLDYIAQFTNDIRYINGRDNAVADALSRLDVNSLQCDTNISLERMAAEQNDDQELKNCQNAPNFKLRTILLPVSKTPIVCDFSTGVDRPFVPATCRKVVFNHIHSLSHPGIRATIRMIRERFVWPRMITDIRQWCSCCIQCQRSKTNEHTIIDPGMLDLPGRIFWHVHIDLVGPLPLSKGFSHILTAVDRYTTWSIPVPIADISAENIVCFH